MLEYLRLRAGDAGFKDGDATHVDQPVVAAPEDQRRRPHLAEPVVERMVAHLRRDHPEDAVELVAIFERVAVEGGLEPRRDMRRFVDDHRDQPVGVVEIGDYQRVVILRSEEPTPELQSLMRISYDGFCSKK